MGYFALLVNNHGKNAKLFFPDKSVHTRCVRHDIPVWLHYLPNGAQFRKQHFQALDAQFKAQEKGIFKFY
jgi:hypothetical protein